MTANTKKRVKQLPKYGTLNRKRMVSVITEMPAYAKALEKGYPFFTKNELDVLENQYKDGLTWDEIERELVAKRIFLKKATFRKYVQDGNLSGAIKYRSTSQGRLAIFPADTISQINFIQYFHKVVTGEIIDELLNLLNALQITYFDAVESELGFYDNIYAAINHYMTDDDGEAFEAISKGLSARPDDRQIALGMLEEIDNAFQTIIGTKIDNLVKFLKGNNLFSGEMSDSTPKDSLEDPVEGQR